MRKTLVFALFTLVLALPLAAQYSHDNTEQAPTVTQVIDRQLSGVEHEFVPLAEAMPDDKFNYAPTGGEFKGVRNFSSQIRHVATTNYMIGAALLGEKPPIDLGKDENGPDLKTKTEIVKFLQDSYAYLHKAFATVNNNNVTEQVENPFGGKVKPARIGLVIVAVGHSFDHYGQCVEYLRANGIIPPASRPQ
ncbi:MAG: DinB family protein [Acidobacteriaceae bacterium]